MEDVEARLVDDAAPDQATVATMAGALISCDLAALTGPCIKTDHTTELLSGRAVYSEPRGN